MKRFLLIFCSFFLVLSMTTMALATPLNLNRPLQLGVSGESSLQQVFDDTFGIGQLDAYYDQSNVGAWTSSEGDTDVYAIEFLSGTQGSLGIYSLTDTTLTYEFQFNGAGSKAGFSILNDGTLEISQNTQITGFGQSFGFYWKAGTTTSYTQDSMNLNGGYGIDNNILALSYLVEEGLVANLPNRTINAKGNDDWVLAFEDWIGGDGDFQDAIFYVEDMAPVPEPGTLVLLGLGLVGLAGMTRKKLSII